MGLPSAAALPDASPVTVCPTAAAFGRDTTAVGSASLTVMVWLVMSLAPWSEVVVSVTV